MYEFSYTRRAWRCVKILPLSARLLRGLCGLFLGLLYSRKVPAFSRHPQDCFGTLFAATCHIHFLVVSSNACQWLCASSFGRFGWPTLGHFSGVLDKTPIENFAKRHWSKSQDSQIQFNLNIYKRDFCTVFMSDSLGCGGANICRNPPTSLYFSRNMFI